MAGIKETKELVGFVLALGNAVGKSLADGMVGWMDLVHFFSAVREAPDAINGLSALPGELADLSEAEKGELFKFVEGKFDIPQDSVEPLLEKAIKAGIILADLIADFRKPKA
jgi:hypothetical protein